MERIESWQRKEWEPREVVRVAVIGFVVLMLLWGVMSSYYTVAPEEEAVVLRFGAYQATTGPGLHWRLPFGVDEVLKVPVTSVRTEEFGFRTLTAGRESSFRSETDESIMLTGDLNIASVDWVVQYRIRDAQKWVFKVLDKSDTIRDLAESIMRAVVGDHTITEVLTSRRVEIERLVMGKLQERLDYYEMGVGLVAVKLQDVTAPEEVKQSFDNVNAAQQKRSTFENEAQKDYNRVINVAEGDAKRQLAEAEGYAADRVNRAKGAVARYVEILKVYKQSPEVTRRRMYLEVMETVLPRVERIVVVDSDGVLQHLGLGKEKR